MNPWITRNGRCRSVYNRISWRTYRSSWTMSSASRWLFRLSRRICKYCRQHEVWTCVEIYSPSTGFSRCCILCCVAKQRPWTRTWRRLRRSCRDSIWSSFCLTRPTRGAMKCYRSTCSRYLVCSTFSVMRSSTFVQQLGVVYTLPTVRSPNCSGYNTWQTKKAHVVIMWLVRWIR